jgi:Zn finger protein HypA/HybF involved in hydrogenase expression
MPLFKDPYTPDARRYECWDCSDRERSEAAVGACRTCGGDVYNVAVPRE